MPNPNCNHIPAPHHLTKTLCHEKLIPNKAEKKRAKVPVKRMFKVRVIAQPMSTNPSLPVNPTLSTDLTPTLVTTTVTLAQMPVAKPVTTIATSIPVTVYTLAQGKFKDILYPAGKSQEKENPSTPSDNNLLVDQPSEAAATATVPQNREDTPWSNTMPASDNLFVERASWPISL